jgi:hypothetical protein
MRPTMMILAVLALAASAPSLPIPSAHAQTLDKDGRCQGPDGKYATAAACKGAGAAPAVSSAYRLDSQGKCRDAKGRMAKAEKCGGVENAPAKAAAAEDKQKP